MLNMTNVNLELSTDDEMCLFFKKGMRGRIYFLHFPKI